MAQIPLPNISQMSSSESPITSEIQQCDTSQIFAERISPADITYDDFFQQYLLQNRPCIFSSELTQGWFSRRDWVDKATGKPDLTFLKEQFGDAVTPVADCGQKKFSSHCKEEMMMSEFLDYWKRYISEGYPCSQKCLYLKDWHFTKAFPSYSAYSTPEYFLSDWMNEFWDSRADTDDDYRFVYMGPKGSWTPLHADVFRSFSWSANICGRKHWIFLAPGEEEKYRDKFGNLVYDINSDELNDPKKYPCFSQSTARIEVIQEPGEVIFVPSGWHHQVHNLEDTISINHNWMNGCNIYRCWKFLKQELCNVQREISDCQGMDGWHEQCQLILKASSGIHYSEFYQYLVSIATHRMAFLQQDQKCDEANNQQCPRTDHSCKLESEGVDHSGVYTKQSHYRSDPVDCKSKGQCKLEENTKDIIYNEKMKGCSLSTEEAVATFKENQFDVCTSDRNNISSPSEKSEVLTVQNLHQNNLDMCQRDTEIDTCQSDKLFDTCQKDTNNGVCKNISDTYSCNVNIVPMNTSNMSKQKINSRKGSVYHAIFDLIQVKQTLVDMLNTDEHKLVVTDSKADSVIEKINSYVW
ncbi:2-oxoglutarate and iron-dependent oxygenase JMJD4-like [Ylistrum balloti]|uniref:2-oxoglutarate and iron-dependent oxygenase JMJD4-like n=1 Tax=Ylistrum balloti TaxID=509963 RepID=UPI002905F094|nr:2-oxoglutarate and iron-dependent oxygenase JMJD4-like [Ylistrum balloti]